GDLARTRAVAEGRVEAGFLRPAAVAVQDHAHVPRFAQAVELAAQPPLVDVVDEFLQPNLERHGGREYAQRTTGQRPPRRRRVTVTTTRPARGARSVCAAGAPAARFRAADQGGETGRRRIGT